MGLFADFAAHAPFLLMATPLFGAVLVWISSRRGLAAARQTALVNATLTLGVAMLMAAKFSADIPPRASSPAQMTSLIPWAEFPAGGRIVLACGVDGVSLAPLLIVALLGWIVLVTADRCGPQWSAKSYVGLLVGQSLAMGVFAAQDFTAFLVGCELWAWWSFFLIGRHGGPERRTAAQSFLVTSSLAHAAWGLAGIGMAVCQAWIQTEVRRQATGISFLYPDMVWSLARSITGNETALEIWTSFQPWVLALCLIGLWLRWPLFPWHGWWPALLSESRPPVAAFCGAVVCLQNGYVLFRFVAPLFPPAGSGWASLLSAGAAFGTLFFGLRALTQTDWRKLGGYLSLGAMQAALLCGLIGDVDVSLAGWQMMWIAALAVAAFCLLAGWLELKGTMIETVANVSRFSSPRWFALMAVSSGLLGAVPCFAFLSGQVSVDLLELNRRGLPNFTLLLGGLCAAWAVIRAWQPLTGTTSAEPSSDLRGRELSIGLLVAAALAVGIAFGTIGHPLRATWERLHDPFSGAVSSNSETTSVTAAKPVIAVEEAASAEVLWIGAPLVWLICGVGLLFVPRAALPAHSGWAIAAIGLGGGLLAEWFGAGASGSPQPIWTRALCWSLGMIGVIEWTVLPTVNRPLSASTAGATLLRFSAIGWAAATNDLLLAGLAWELAELARWLSHTGESQRAVRTPKEWIRYGVSSGCFWIGAALCLWLTQTGNLHAIAGQLATFHPHDNDGHAVGLAPRAGLAAILLLLSAVGVRGGLVPWSFGRCDDRPDRRGGAQLLDPWLDRLLAVTMLIQLAAAFSPGYAGPMLVMLAIAAAATAVWAGVSCLGEPHAIPLLRGMIAAQFAAAVLLIAVSAAQSAAASRGISASLPGRGIVELQAMWCLAITLAVCGLSSILLRLGEPAYGELFPEQYRGLFAKRGLEATLLTALLIGLLARWPLAGFWPTWLGMVQVAMTPQRLSDDQLRSHPVLLAAALLLLLAGILLLSRVAEWIRCLAFDPPAALPDGSGRRWELVLALGIVVASVIVAVAPSLWMFVLFGRH